MGRNRIHAVEMVIECHGDYDEVVKLIDRRGNVVATFDRDVEAHEWLRRNDTRYYQSGFRVVHV